VKVIIVNFDLQEISQFPPPEHNHGGDRLVRLIRFFRRSAQKLFRISKRFAVAAWKRAIIAICWMCREFWEPTLCFCCVYLGVLSTMLLPSTLAPTLAGIALSPLAAIPVAVIVVDARAHKRWRASERARLGMRLLRACSDGILWWCWWRKL
jgi:hypothetical protein